MNGIAAPIVAAESAPLPDFLKPRHEVSVVMVVYMTGEALEQSLACVLADPRINELVVVDNGSTPVDAAALRALADREKRVTLVRGQGNVGFACGANLGAREATGDVFVFLNPDAFLQPGCISELVRALDGHPEPCIVGGRILNTDRTEQRGARRGDITLFNALMSLSGLAHKMPGCRRHDVHWEKDAPPDQVAPVPTVSGACLAMRRADFEAVGGFDEAYFLHVEDVDLCWRVRQQGGVVLFQPKAEVIHLGHTSQTSPLRVEYHKGVGLARYFRKRADGAAQALVAWVLTPLIICTAVARPMMWWVKGA